MSKFKKNDIVVRISYNKDVLFEITQIIKMSNNKNIYILKGITERIEADSPEEDLEKVDKRVANVKMKEFEDKLYERIKMCLKEPYYCIINNNNKEKRGKVESYTGRILHLDGDKRYSEKSIKYYKSLGLDAIVKNVPENKQPLVINSLLERYNPDVLIVTGHDGMIKKGTAYNDIYNYRNSRHFINTVNEARKWAKNRKDLSIFAGACQSYYEGIMIAGANFASSPARIMIDFLDPLIVAERIATTDNTKYLTIEDIKEELRDGEAGISGIGSVGKKKQIITTL